MTEFKAVKVGDQVKVDFVSESRTEFSGNRFTGEGVVDRVEDGRVFGRLDNGMPFMCGVDDVQVITGQSDIHDVFQKWFMEQEFYKNLRYQEGNRLFLRDGDVYRYLPVHMTFVTWSENQKWVNELERWNKNQYDLLKQQGSKLEKLTSLAMELEGIAKTLDVNEGRGSYYDSAYRIKEALRDETQPTSTR